MMNIRKLLAVISGFVVGFFGKSYALTLQCSDDQQSLTIYQIMVASFQHADDGAPGYTQMWGPDGHTKNGNLRGIINSLDYIKSLGANAIWLTPIFDSSQAYGGEKLQATGYFTNNFFAVDPNFGTEDDLRELVDEAHRRGIYVILDGVFGHHGGVTLPSPSGHTIDSTVTFSDRGPDGGSGNVRYPGSLDYFKEVATYWIDNFGIDGWRLDQCYQAVQGGHNYWQEIREAVEQTAAARKARGEQWGTLAYMVGEDWGPAVDVNRRSLKQHGLLSVFDFDGKELISGAMQNAKDRGLKNGFADIITAWSSPSARGWLNDSVMPNLYLTNHDGYRVADHFDPADPHYYQKLMTLNAILAGYNGPITLYYGDEYADRSLETRGGQPDNISRTLGHLEPRNASEAELRDYIADIMHFRRDNPAMWRGTTQYTHDTSDGHDLLIARKHDPATDNTVVVIFSDIDRHDLRIDGIDHPVDVKAWRPVYYRI